MRERQRDPDAIPAFTEAARSMLRLGENREASRRALDHAPDDVLVLHGRRDRLVPVAFAEAGLRRHPTWPGPVLHEPGPAPDPGARGRRPPEVADRSAAIVRARQGGVQVTGPDAGGFDRHLPTLGLPTFAHGARFTQRYQATLLGHHIGTLRRLKYRPTGGFCLSSLADAAPRISTAVLDHQLAGGRRIPARVPALGRGARQFTDDR